MEYIVFGNDTLWSGLDAKLFAPAQREIVHSNWQLVGWNGLHKYNNQDHSMVTAFCAARNILGARHDIWAINNDPDYHERDSSKAEI